MGISLRVLWSSNHLHRLKCQQAACSLVRHLAAWLQPPLKSLRPLRRIKDVRIDADKVADINVSNSAEHCSVGSTPSKSLSRRPYANLQLPIQNILPEILENVKQQPNLVLQAPPGAGKTTVVPLAVLESGHVHGLILVLQPRRIACIGAAKRLAQLWGEPLGKTIGYRIRHEAVTSNQTRLEVVTDGILVRMLHGNPSLDGVGCIFFDEFHERNLDSDLSFALCLAAQQRHNPDLRLMVMSATFGTLGQRVADLLSSSSGSPSCPLIFSEGRCFPVDVKYRGSMKEVATEQAVSAQRMEHLVAETVRDALDEHPGDILAFLPGEQEIMYVWIFLNNMGIGDGQVPKRLIGWAHKLIDKGAVDLSRRVQVCPLYGTLDQEEQDEVLQAPATGWRKVILATPIAESSLTVPGVRIVIDCGLRRVKVSEPSTCMSYMRTLPISVASADQRRGRAGRVSTGVCYRLWSEEEHDELDASDESELQREDLASCVLDLALAGFCSDDEVYRLPWVDAPSATGIGSARELLQRMKALQCSGSDTWVLTERGRQLGKFPLHPRLGHAILLAREISSTFAREACDFAALLAEKELLRGGRLAHGANLDARINALHQDDMPDVFHGVRRRIIQASGQLQQLINLQHQAIDRQLQTSSQRFTAVLVCWAFPELLAISTPPKGKGKGKSNRHARSTGDFKLHNGSHARVDRNDMLAGSSHLAIAALTGEKVFWAVEANPALLASFGIDIHDPVSHQLLHSLWDEAADGDPVKTPQNEKYSCQHRVSLRGGWSSVPEAWWSQGDWSHSNHGFRQNATSRRTKSMPPQIRVAPQQPTVKTRLCPAFQRGSCMAGKDCSFAHGPEELTKSMKEHPQAFPTSDIVRMLWDFCKVQQPHQVLIGNIAKEVKSRAIEFTPIELTEVLCTLASASVRADDVFETLANMIEPRLAELPLDGQTGNVSALLWAFTDAGIVHEPLFQSMATRAVDVMKSFRPRVLSDTREICFWSFHRASAESWSNRGQAASSQGGFAHPAFFQALAPLASANLTNISAIVCVYLIWSYSKAGIFDAALFDAVANRVGGEARNLDRCGLSMLPWNFAYIGIENQEVYRLSAMDILRPARMAELAPRDVSVITWAYAKARVAHRPLFAALAQHGYELLQDSLSQCCYRNTTKSLAREVYANDNSAVDGAVDAFDMMTMADVLWAYTEVNIDVTKFLVLGGDYMAIGLSQRGDLAQKFLRYPEAIVKCMRAYAHFALPHHAFFKAAGPHCLRCLGCFKFRDLSTILWAWATCGPWDKNTQETVAGSLAEALQKGDVRSMQPEDISKLTWALSAVRQEDARSMEVLARLSSQHRRISTQALAILCDMLPERRTELGPALLVCVEAASELFDAMAAAFKDSKSGKTPPWHDDCYSEAIRCLDVEHYGQMGTQILLNLTGLSGQKSEIASQAASDVLAKQYRPANEVRCSICIVDVKLSVGKRLLLEFSCSLHRSTAQEAERCLADVKSSLFPLRAASLASGRAGDRASCSEFQALSKICSSLGEAVDISVNSNRAAIHGHVKLHMAVAPCISGIGAAKQFQLLFPHVFVKMGFND